MLSEFGEEINSLKKFVFRVFGVGSAYILSRNGSTVFSEKNNIYISNPAYLVYLPEPKSLLELSTKFWYLRSSGKQFCAREILFDNLYFRCLLGTGNPINSE